jgi:hypothetical protein
VGLRAKARRQKEGRRGTALVVHIDDRRTEQAWMQARMTLVVREEDGRVRPRPSQIRPLVPRDAWPVRGQILPVIVGDEEDEDVDVVWDEVPTIADRTRAEAEAIIAAMSDRHDDPVEELSRLVEDWRAGRIDAMELAARKLALIGP